MIGKALRSRLCMRCLCLVIRKADELVWSRGPTLYKASHEPDQSGHCEALSIAIYNLSLGIFEGCFHFAAADRLVERFMVALVLVRVCDRKFR